MPAPPPPKSGQFKPGMTGNPGGRPKTKKVRAALRYLQPSAKKALEAALAAGEPWAVTLWFHYYYGKPVDQLQLTGKGGEALAVTISINRTVKADEPTEE